MHVRDDNKLAEPAMGNLAMFKMYRDDSGDPATAGQYRVGNAAHKPVAAAAVNQLDPARREPGPEFARCRSIAGIGAVGGAAIDAEPPNFADWMLHAKPVDLLP